MINLPPEVLESVCNQCDVATLKALRQVCKSLSQEATRKTFQVVTLDILPTSVSMLHLIAQNPLLSRYAKVLRVSMNLLRGFDLQAFRARFNTRVPRDLSGRTIGKQAWPLTREELWVRRCHSRYKCFQQAQRRILHSPITLPVILSKFKYLRGIIFRTLSSSDETSHWVRFGNIVFGHTDPLLLRTFCDVRDDVVCKKVMLILQEPEVGLTSVVLDNALMSTVLSLNGVAPNLQKCLLRLRRDPMQNESSSLTLAKLQGLLGNTYCLRTFHLELPPTCTYLTRFSIERVFRDIELPSLRDLKLQMGSIGPQGLLHICLRLNFQLRRLALLELYLEIGRWQDLLPILSSRLPECSIFVEALSEGDGWSIITAIPYGKGLTLPKACGRQILAGDEGYTSEEEAL